VRSRVKRGELAVSQTPRAAEHSQALLRHAPAPGVRHFGDQPVQVQATQQPEDLGGELPASLKRRTSLRPIARIIFRMPSSVAGVASSWKWLPIGTYACTATANLRLCARSPPRSVEAGGPWNADRSSECDRPVAQAAVLHYGHQESLRYWHHRPQEPAP